MSTPDQGHEPRILKSPAFWINIAALIGALGAFSPPLLLVWKGEPITDNTVLELIVGGIFLWVGGTLSTITTLIDQKKGFHTENQRITALAASSSDLLNFYSLLSTGSWGRRLFETIVALAKNCGNNAHLNSRLIAVADALVNEFEAKFHLDEDLYPEAEESKRMRRLELAVECAERYIYAANYDGGEYIKLFWSGHSQESMRKSIKSNARRSSDTSS